MQAGKILVVEDEQEICDLLQFSLTRAGFSVNTVYDGESALEALQKSKPNLVLIDWMLPGIDGVELARRIRHNQTTRKLPLIMLTARSEEADKLQSFDSGVDDYITKPFSTRELTARIKAVIRRSGETRERKLTMHTLEIDRDAHHVHVDGELLHLRPTEYKILEVLVQNANRVFSREQLMESVWDSTLGIDPRTVDVHIQRLRKALKPFKLRDFIQTVWSIGYRVNPQYLHPSQID